MADPLKKFADMVDEGNAAAEAKMTPEYLAKYGEESRKAAALVVGGAADEDDASAADQTQSG